MGHLFTNRAALPVMILLVCVLLAVGGHQIVLVLERIAEMQAAAADAMLTHPAVIFLLICYVLLLAIPFVPGAELGFMLLLLFGADIALIVYLATIAGMMLSFVVGRVIPQAQVAHVLEKIGLRVLGQKVRMHKQSDMPSASLTTRAWLLKLLKHRYAALALVINTPGNTILGGGGGLALAAGASRLYRPIAFFGTIVIAVSPVPLAIMFLMP